MEQKDRSLKTFLISLAVAILSAVLKWFEIDVDTSVLLDGTSLNEILLVLSSIIVAASGTLALKRRMSSAPAAVIALMLLAPAAQAQPLLASSFGGVKEVGPEHVTYYTSVQERTIPRDVLKLFVKPHEQGEYQWTELDLRAIGEVASFEGLSIPEWPVMADSSLLALQDSLEQAVNDYVVLLDGLRSTNSQLRASNDSLNAEVLAKEQEVTALSATRDSLAAEVGTLTASVADLRAKVQEYEGFLAFVRRLIQTMDAAKREQQ